MTRALIFATLVAAAMIPSPALAQVTHPAPTPPKVTPPAEPQGTPAYLAPYLIADRDSEVALARSAAPKRISDSATVLVLTKTGYVVAHTGTNGFTCLVVRSYQASLTDSTSWDPRVRAPHCLNPQATRTVLPEMKLRARLVFGGTPIPQAAARIARGYSTHELPLPAPGSMAYMMSHEQWLGPNEPAWHPHVMFYYPRTMKAANWGAGGMTAPLIDGSIGDRTSPIWALLIPLPQWADGTPVAVATTP